MKHYLQLLLAIFAGVLFTSCEETQTYAEMLDKEKEYISNFISKRGYTTISESAFDPTRPTPENTFVLFRSDGLYLHIDSIGTGPTIYSILDTLTQKQSGTRLVILTRFLEYSLSQQDTIVTNFYTNAAPEQFYYAMNATQSYYSSAASSSTYGKFFASPEQTETVSLMRTYYGTSVPAAWLKPLQYVGNGGRVRVIAPSKMGTSSATQSVLPYYYEIHYTIY